MKFTLNRVVHYYYLLVLVLMTSAFGYGVFHYWSIGTLNIDSISGLYDGTNRVKVVKDRNNIDEIKKFVDSDRIKEAQVSFTKLDQDIKDLKVIKSIEDQSFEENYKKLKDSIVELQTAPELTSILANVTTKVSQFEAFVTEKKWPTLTRMAVGLRNKTAQAKLVSSGLYNFERVVNLSQSINNDLEAMTNFTEGSGLAPDIKQAIINRMKPIRKETEGFSGYVEQHKKFARIHKEFSTNYHNWFKLVEPEIALKKLEFEKSSQTLAFSVVGMMTFFLVAIVLGVIIYNFSVKVGSEKLEKIVLDTVKDDILPTERKGQHRFSPGFEGELNKYRDYVHKRMTFGAIVQEALPFASIMLDSNLNLIWGNLNFYQSFKLENFKDEDDSLTWDFLQRFTDLEDNSAVLSALRMSTAGIYKIKVKTTSMDNQSPFEMHVSPVDYAGQKRIMIIFYPLNEVEAKLEAQKEAIVSPVLNAITAQKTGTLTPDQRTELRSLADKNYSGLLFKKVFEYVDTKENELDSKNHEIEKLEAVISEKNATITQVRNLAVSSFETQRSSVDEYNKFKASISMMLDSREQLEDQFKFTMNSSREIFKDQNKIIQASEKAEQTVDEYIKSLKTITNLKTEFKDLKYSVEDFKSRIVQVLDQLLIFQNQEGDTLKIDQFLGKIKIEMKGFEKILFDFNQVVTQMDVTVTKIDMMIESRERIDVTDIKYHMESVKNNMDNAQFSVSKLTQVSHQKDDEMINSLKVLIGNLKSEMKRVDELCKTTGLTEEYLNVISPKNESRV
jgi:hypothetical protein